MPRSTPKTAAALITATRELSTRIERLKFSAPVAYVGNPLNYAREPHELYLAKYANGPKRILFLGMNPGPFGMAQTGVPFGEIAAARDWLGIFALVPAPAHTHPKRPVLGFACTRSEVSGRRLWGLFQERFSTPGKFFAEHFVVNYCPLVFSDEGGRNLTPDKFPTEEQVRLFALCDDHLRQTAKLLNPEWVIGVGAFAAERAAIALAGTQIKIGQILHPSPASPAANRGWSAAATRQLTALGVWK